MLKVNKFVICSVKKNVELYNLLVVSIMPSSGLHIKNCILHLPQDIQILLKRILYLLKTPCNFRTPQSSKDREWSLLPTGIATKLRLSFTDFFKIFTSLNKSIDLSENAAPVEEPLDFTEAVVSRSCLVVGVFPGYTAFDTLV